jgi:hypothetical protein
MGADDERNQIFGRWFAAPWEKDSVLAFTKFDEEGVTYLNTSYILPQMVLREIAQSVAAGENPAESATRLSERIYQQFMGESVNLSPILKALANQKMPGVPLTYERGLKGALERADHPLQVIGEPGLVDKVTRTVYALREAERKGRKFSVDQEARRLLGMREVTRTWDDLVLRKYRDLSRDEADIRMAANRAIGENLPGAKARAVAQANEQLAALRAQVARFEKEADKLGVPGRILLRAKKESTIGRIPDVALDVDGKRVKSLGGR